MFNTPNVLHETASGGVITTLLDEQFARREIEIVGTIDRTLAMDTVRALRYLSFLNSKLPITMLINSNGGDILPGLSIYDTMRTISCPVYTICVGEASSMGALLLAAGEKGHRAMLKNSSVMIHDPIQAGGGGPALCVEEQTKKMMRMRQQIAEIMAESTGQSIEEVLKKTAKDYYSDAHGAIEFGLVDGVIKSWGGGNHDS